MTSGKELHVVFGAGQVGPLLAGELVAAGKAVKIVRRSSTRVEIQGVEVTRADAGDSRAAVEATRGAAVIYNCMNPPYSAREWARELPRIQEGLIAAARENQARLVVLDNVYMLGRPEGRPLTEESPLAPCSKKGEIRARIHEELQAAVKRGDVRAVKGHASDFYGPGGTGTYFAGHFWPGAFARKTVKAFINLDTLHTYHYIPDVAAGLAKLGLDEAAGGSFMLPCRPAVTTRRLIERLTQTLGHTVVLSRTPSLLMNLLGVFVPIVRELNEMAYQWEEPFILDDSKFRGRYGDITAPEDVAAKRTLEWARVTYG